MSPLPPEDVAGFYAGAGLLVLILSMWIPYMIRSIYWNIKEDREARLATTQKT